MKKIGLISDTHSYFDMNLFKYLIECDEVWHAGDIGSEEIIETISSKKPLIAVFGNIDTTVIRKLVPEHQRFICEEVDVWITHIGGYPGKYGPAVRNKIFANPPGLFVSGHSHILKVMYDKRLNLLHLNPGAAGIQGFHTIRTMLRFDIDKAEVKNMEIIELGIKK